MNDQDLHNQEVLKNNPNIPGPMLWRKDEIEGADFYIHQAIVKKEKVDKSVSLTPSNVPQLVVPEISQNMAANFAVENAANDTDAARMLVDEAIRNGN